MDIYSVLVAIMAAVLSGMGTAIVSSFKDAKKEKIRRQEKEQDQLRLEIKDLKIELYKLEKELYEWKDKYYSAIQELISVKAELEKAIINLDMLEIESLDPED